MIAFPISIRDMNTQTIPNVYLKFLAVLTAVYLFIDGFGNMANLLVGFIVLCLLVAFRVGMGDVKLIALTMLIVNSQMDFSVMRYFPILLICALAHLLIQGLVNWQLPERIALAPSIFLAFALYLSAR
jgi:Flp pilus assembly protein protease CpaA